MKKRKGKNPKRILTRKKPEKGLTLFFKRSVGRGSDGRIAVRHKGGGVKKLYRIIDFGQQKIDIPAKVIALEYDPNRTCFISLLEYNDGEKRYRIASHGLNVGDEVICADKAEIKIGNRMQLKNIPVGTQVYNIELEPERGGKLARGAGTSIKVLAHEGKYAHVSMPSTESRKVLAKCFASIGQVSFPEHKFIRIKKAGSVRLKGKRPTVRGSAMSAYDHPHGGGEGKAPIGLKHPKTPWGKPALGVKTRKKRWTSKLIIQRRKKKKKS